MDDLKKREDSRWQAADRIRTNSSQNVTEPSVRVEQDDVAQSHVYADEGGVSA